MSGAASVGMPDALALTLEVRHDTHYRYASPVSLAQHEAHLRPLQDGAQALEAFALAIDPAPAHRRDSIDAMGNTQTHFALAQPHQALRVSAVSRLRVSARFRELRPEASPPWEELVARLKYVAGVAHEPAVQFAQPSPYVPRLQELRAYARPTFTAGRPVVMAALELMQRMHADFRYQSQSTEVDTPLATAFAQRRGVCQDFAHLMIGALRMLGLPVRYVSGYLLTWPPEMPAGSAPMLGADASHAWAQLWCPATPGVPSAGPGSGWLDLDPTNNLVPGTGHVRVAIGRDYGDVTPLRGVIRGSGQHQLSVAVTTRVVGPVSGLTGPPVLPNPARHADFPTMRRSERPPS